MFKKTFLMLAALAYVAPSVYAERQTIWTQGTNNGTNIFDADKSEDCHDDDLLCWAASASNMIAWWQRQNPEAAAAAQAPMDVEDIWEVYKKTFQDQGGDRYSALDWWFEGDNTYSGGGLPARKSDTYSGGYYEGMVKNLQNMRKNLLWQKVGIYGEFADTREALSLEIVDLLESGYIIGLSVAQVSGLTGEVSYVGNSHAITLWGLEFDETTKLMTGMWISDSDDAQGGWGNYEKDLVKLTLNPVTVTYGETTFQTYTFTSENVLPEDKYYPPYSFYNEKPPYAIVGYTYLNGSAEFFDIPTTPEPATATLCLAALVGCMGRRRRRA